MSRQDVAALGLAVFLLAVPLARATGRMAPPAWADGPAHAVSPVGRLLFGAGLDPNVASADELTVLPGIGPARAAAIVAQRKRAVFCRPEDLEHVYGLGPVTVARLRSWISLDPLPRGCSSSGKS